MFIMLIMVFELFLSTYMSKILLLDVTELTLINLVFVISSVLMDNNELIKSKMSKKVIITFICMLDFDGRNKIQ
jgi:hypothetical protein